MEKYSGWRDPGTGIQPFLAPKPPRKDDSVIRTIVLGLKNYVVGPPLAAIKLAVIAVAGVLAYLLDLVGLVLSGVPGVHHTWRHIVYGLIGRIVLLLGGFWWISSTSVSLRRGARRPAGADDRSSAAKTGRPSVDLIVANHSSYIDVIYFGFRYAPVFLHVAANGHVRPMTFWQALSSAGSYPDLDDAKDLVKLGDYIKQITKSAVFVPPIVVFPEGTTSNGRGLLKFLPVFKDVDLDELNVQIHIVGLKYVYDEWCPTYTVGSRLSHAFWTLAQFSNTLEVRQLPPAEVSISLDPSTVASVSVSPDEGLVGSQVSSQLGQLLRVRKTSKNAVDKRSFLDFYEERENRQYNKKQRS
ncbi:hypothetical protein BC831DRAFT_440152 [Entophlyctis helioformis]|nr:hypothetical protein BC831DRAFT_440152 [Entophlyctis helioformis]